MDNQTKVVIVGASDNKRRLIIAALLYQIDMQFAICNESDNFDKSFEIKARPPLEDNLININVSPYDLGPIKHRKGGKKSRRIWRL